MLDNAIIFDSRIAEKYSLEEAIVISKLYGWIKHNATNGKNYHDGRYWTFNSLSAFAKYFHFWSESKVKRILIDLAGCTEKSDSKPKHEPVIIKGNFNKSSFDRTIWYSFTDDFFAYLEKLGYDLNADIPQAENGFSADGQMDVPPADEQYQLLNTNNKKEENKKDKSFLSKKDVFSCSDFLLGLINAGVEESVARDWMSIRKAKKASNTATALKLVLNAFRTIKERYGISENDAITICVARGWYGCAASYFENIKLTDYGIQVGHTDLPFSNNNNWE